MARMAALRPGASPPAVRTPIRNATPLNPTVSSLRSAFAHIRRIVGAIRHLIVLDRDRRGRGRDRDGGVRLIRWIVADKETGTGVASRSSCSRTCRFVKRSVARKL